VRRKRERVLLSDFEEELGTKAHPGLSFATQKIKSELLENALQTFWMRF